MISSSHPTVIRSWHAHIYFDAPTRDAAWALRERITAELSERVQIGRFHEKPVGPHPVWTYQLAFNPDQFTFVIEWLTLNHEALDVFVHPNTGDAYTDHKDRALWIGRSYELHLAALLPG